MFNVYIVLYQSPNTLWEKLYKVTIVKRRGKITTAMEK